MKVLFIRKQSSCQNQTLKTWVLGSNKGYIKNYINKAIFTFNNFLSQKLQEKFNFESLLNRLSNEKLITVWREFSFTETELTFLEIIVEDYEI